MTHCQMLRIQAMYFDSIRCYASYCVTINTGVFLGNVFGPPQKPWLWTEKTKKGASSPGLGVRNAANAVCSSVGPTEFAAEPTPRRQIRNLNSSPSTKKTTEFSFELFLFLLIKLFLTFVVSTKTRVTMRFRARNAGYSTGLSQVYATSYWCPCGAHGRTDVQMDGQSRVYYVTAKIYWIDWLPNLLSNGAPLVRYARRLGYKEPK